MRPPVKSHTRKQSRLVIFGGLPGVGKTAIARELARQMGAFYVRIDSIEQSLRDSGAVRQPLDDAGYRVGYSIAEDNLRLGCTVVADCVNPLAPTRDAWLDVAKRAGAAAVEVEITCSDRDEHRRRIETRASDVPGLRLPTWEEVLLRKYHPWRRKHIVIDTAGRTLQESVSRIREVLRRR